MKIEVKQEHIEKGKRRDCLSCPVTLAVQEAVGTEDVFTTYFDIHVKNQSQKDYDHFPLSEEVENFICLFDLGKKVKPFSFELEI